MLCFVKHWGRWLDNFKDDVVIHDKKAYFLLDKIRWLMCKWLALGAREGKCGCCINVNSSKWYLLLFFPYFRSYSPFSFFSLYFKAASRRIMKINTPNWSLRLVECIMILILHSCDVTTWRHELRKCRQWFRSFWVLFRSMMYFYWLNNIQVI